MENDAERIRALEKELDDLRDEFRGYVRKKSEEEASRLRTALLVAFGVISGLGSFIWMEVVWPVIKMGKV